MSCRSDPRPRSRPARRRSTLRYRSGTGGRRPPWRRGRPRVAAAAARGRRPRTTSRQRRRSHARDRSSAGSPAPARSRSALAEAGPTSERPRRTGCSSGTTQSPTAPSRTRGRRRAPRRTPRSRCRTRTSGAGPPHGRMPAARARHTKWGNGPSPASHPPGPSARAPAQRPGRGGERRAEPANRPQLSEPGSPPFPMLHRHSLRPRRPRRPAAASASATGWSTASRRSPPWGLHGLTA